MHTFTGVAVAALALALSPAALAKEYPIGKPQEKAGMEIAAVYLQPIEMEPAGMMTPAKDADVHMEADIKATKSNVNGFAKGDWVPYLVIGYEVTKDGQTVAKGDFMPMVANDGPHYGENVKLAGPGKYTVSYHISPPTASHSSHFGRHVDKETGVKPWFEPFTVTNDFVYTGTGKKGGY